MALYYRKCVKDFSAIARRPLIHLTKKDVPFKWIEDYNIAFTKIKKCLTGQDIMGFPMSNEEFSLDIDGSNYILELSLVKYKIAKKELFHMPVEP